MVKVSRALEENDGGVSGKNSSRKEKEVSGRKQYSSREVVDVFSEREKKKNTLLSSLRNSPEPNIIAEIKKASPFGGVDEGSFLPFLEE